MTSDLPNTRCKRVALDYAIANLITIDWRLVAVKQAANLTTAREFLTLPALRTMAQGMVNQN
jgi:hypothetical protein